MRSTAAYLVDGRRVLEPVATSHVLQLQHRLEDAGVDVRALDVDLGARGHRLILGIKGGGRRRRRHREVDQESVRGSSSRGCVNDSSKS